MKFITALVITTISTIASTAVVSSSKTDNIAVLDGLGNVADNVASAPTNNNLVDGSNTSNSNGSGGKPSASQHRAQKSHRIAERRARVKAAIANLPHEPNSNLEKMTDEELAKAVEAAEESSSGKFGLNPGGGFIRKARQDLKESQMSEGERKLWGNGGNGDPYQPAGGMTTETDYYGEDLFILHATLCHVFVHMMCTLITISPSSCKHNQQTSGNRPTVS